MAIIPAKDHFLYHKHDVAILFVENRFSCLLKSYYTKWQEGTIFFGHGI
jgi:hypothetical protein